MNETSRSQPKSAVKHPKRCKRILLNACTWWTAATIVFLVHLGWAMLQNEPGYLQRGGGLVIICGILAIARPILRIGIASLVEGKLPFLGVFPVPSGTTSKVRADMRPEVTLDERAVQRHGPALIAIGTLISSYGDLLLRHFGIGSGN